MKITHIDHALCALVHQRNKAINSVASNTCDFPWTAPLGKGTTLLHFLSLEKKNSTLQSWREVNHNGYLNQMTNGNI